MTSDSFAFVSGAGSVRTIFDDRYAMFVSDGVQLIEIGRIAPIVNDEDSSGTIGDFLAN